MSYGCSIDNELNNSHSCDTAHYTKQKETETATKVYKTESDSDKFLGMENSHVCLYLLTITQLNGCLDFYGFIDQEINGSES